MYPKTELSSITDDYKDWSWSENENEVRFIYQKAKRRGPAQRTEHRRFRWNTRRAFSTSKPLNGWNRRVAVPTS